MEYLLELKEIHKSYGATRANQDINIKVKKGEIRALLGENGAGKSTLVKIIYGIVRPDQGEIYWKGELLKKHNPDIIKKLGIQMVFQHFNLLDSFTVSDNIALSLSKIPKNLNQKIKETSQKYGLNIDPEKRILNLSVGEKQRVEIVRALIQNPKLLILDEPTSVLNPIEIETLFHFLKQLALEGCSILYISHKLNEIKILCDKVTILRQGKVIMHCDPQKETNRSLAEKMMGSSLTAVKRSKAHSSPKKEKYFEVKNLSMPAKDQNIGIKNISFSIAPKEILAIAGVLGNGQKVLQDTLFGLIPCSSKEQIVLNKEAIGNLNLKQRCKKQMAFVPAERLGIGAVPEMDLIKNNFLTSSIYFQDYQKKGWINESKVSKDAQTIIDDYKVVTSSKKAEARSLSGGNLQKFIIGRAIFAKPKLLIVIDPTWGIDVGAKNFIHQVLLDLAASGTAILLISQDLEEIYEVSDKIAVLFEGKLSKSYPTSKIDNQKIGLLMGGEKINE
jgi:simple sugar transport system ATP-binding protein